MTTPLQFPVRSLACSSNMKRLLDRWFVVIGTLLLLQGCSKKEEVPETPVSSVKPTANPTTLTPTQRLVTAPPVRPSPPTAPAPPPSFPQARPNPFPRLEELTNQLITASAAQSDPVLASITVAVGRITTIFAQAVPGNTNAHGRLELALEQLTSGHDAAALRAMGSLKDAKLLPEQARVARSVKDAVAALVVQKNFNSLAGSGNEMAQIVSALRQGDPNTAVHALQMVTSGAQLSTQQKAILDELLAEYAPSLKDGADAPVDK